MVLIRPGGAQFCTPKFTSYCKSLMFDEGCNPHFALGKHYFSERI